MVKIVQIKTRSTGRTRPNLRERRAPLGLCHTAPPASAMTAASKRGRSAVISLAVVVVVAEVVRMPEPERRALLEPVKQRQPPPEELVDWFRLRFRLGLLSRSCSAKHFW